MALPFVAVRLQTVATAQRREQTPLPAIWQCELVFQRLLGFQRGAEGLLYSLDGGCRGISLADSGRPLEQGRDLAQSLAELLLTGHLGFSDLTTRWYATPGARLK